MRDITSDEKLVWAKTIYGEARGESMNGQLAIGYVIFNRAALRNQSITDICLAPKQFPCWNKDERAILDAVTPATLEPQLRYVDYILNDIYGDITKGSDHYCLVTVHPTWATGHKPVVTIGKYKFYNDITTLKAKR